MSGSPKYSQATLAAEQERRLADERRQQAQAAERRRRQREADEQRRQFEQSRSQLQHIWIERRGLLKTHRAAPISRFITAAWPKLQARLEAGSAACENARSIDQLHSVRLQVEELDSELASALARAQAMEQAERLQQQLEHRAALLTTEFMLAQGEAATIDATLAAQLDASGAATLRNALHQSRDLLEGKQLDAAERCLQLTRDALHAHQEQIRIGRLARIAARETAEKALSGLQSQLSGLQEDEVVMSWCSADVAVAADHCAQATRELAAEQFAAATQRCQQTTATLSALLPQVEQRQLEEERRSYLVNSLVEVLRQQDFLVSEPQLSAASDLDSTVVIHATRPDRRSILLQIPKSGPVAYDVDGYEKRIEGDPGDRVTTCEEAEARLVAIHTQLEADFGIQMGEVYWDGRDPQRQSRDGRPLPSSASAARKRGL